MIFLLFVALFIGAVLGACFESYIGGCIYKRQKKKIKELESEIRALKSLTNIVKNVIVPPIVKTVFESLVYNNGSPKEKSTGKKRKTTS